ncbi:hypothetical protein SPF06_02125 [Sinomonas sp. JGH33]|uniref:DUF4089 domain-containing protein n=1 Tax=Sinomonas terricola TaxID=3110330 RepID=A0ABU5T1I3_9MICC|nr:hypothetical protein [Sinomonas sp. JGH33]MEA5453510.1 hypothetical protein [Sinomonas sp. JGH33]
MTGATGTPGGVAHEPPSAPPPVTGATVRAAASLVGLLLSDAECEALVPRVAAYMRMGLLIAHAADTDVLPTDDPRWFFRD